MKKQIVAILIIFFTITIALYAQPQSFFIAPGQVIENNNIVRGFCLEYTKESLNNQNISELKQITGNVLVTFKDGTSRIMPFEDLYYKEKLIHISGYGSPQYIKINLDNRIARITVPDTEGIVLARENMSAAENILKNKNVSLITEMLRNGSSHQAAQNAAWLNKNVTKHTDEKTKTITLDHHTSPVGRQLIGKYGKTAAVVFDHYSGEYRFDGLRTNASTQTKAVYDFLTHFHSDHIDYRTLEQLLQNSLKSSVYFPLPMLDRSIRKRSFQTMQSIADSGDYDFDIINFVCELLPLGRESNTPVINGFISQFFYSKYEFGDLTIETYRHINPKNENADSLIYRLQYQGVYQLILGDFDDEKALADLFRCSEENYKKRMEMLEERYDLERQLYVDGGISETARLRRSELQEKLQLLPTIRADVVKWPHHAHIISVELAEQLNKVVNPNYFIYQVHSAQDLQVFKSFIKKTTFPEKFINSGEYEVNIISLLELLKVLRQG